MDQTPAEASNKLRVRSPKAAFVLSLPLEMKANDVVEKAKSAGLIMTANHVHAIRSDARKASGPPGRAAKASKMPAAAAKGPKTPSGAKAGKKATTTKAAKPAGRKGRGGDKKAFILAQPATLTNAEVIAKAQQAGMSISLKHVRKVRDKAGIVGAKAAKVVRTAAVKARPGKPATKKTTAKKATRAGSARTPKRATSRPVPASPVKAATPEILFRKLVLELGLKRSRELLVEVEHKLAELIAGD